MFETPPVGCLVMSYHDNGDYYLVLDTNGPKYLWFDLQDFDHPVNVGTTVTSLLDWWWQQTDWLDPRREQKTGKQTVAHGAAGRALWNLSRSPRPGER